MPPLKEFSEETILPNFESVQQLKDFLTNSGIDTTLYGQGEAKDLNHLFDEIKDGETILVQTPNGLLRRVVVGGADVYYSDNGTGKTYRLTEAMQIFEDGRTRVRNLGNAVSEKFKATEIDVKQAMQRGIQEELGLEEVLSIEYLNTDTEERASPSYPGLQSQYLTHRFKVNLSPDQFRPNGSVTLGAEEFAYVEHQEGRKDTYFRWEEVF